MTAVENITNTRPGFRFCIADTTDWPWEGRNDLGSHLAETAMFTVTIPEHIRKLVRAHIVKEGRLGALMLGDRRRQTRDGCVGVGRPAVEQSRVDGNR